MYMVFDTETTGLPKNYNAPVTDSANWPRIIQIAWVVITPEGQEVKKSSHLIKPDGWVVPTEKFWIDNGYSTEKNTEFGVPLKPLLEEFLEDSYKCTALVAHNMQFDSKIVGAELFRYEVKVRQTMPKICTKETSTNYCKLPKPKGGYKWPKLEELHTKLFGVSFEGAHDALYDVRATAVCFIELRRLGIIK